MFNLLLALITGLVIGWNFHSFFMQLNPPNILKNDIKIEKVINEKTIPIPIDIPTSTPRKEAIQEIKKDINITKKISKEVLIQKEKISTLNMKKTDSFYEYLKSNLFSEAMMLYIDASDTKLLLYQPTLVEYFENKIKENPQQALEQMIEFQELVTNDTKINMEILHEIEDNDYIEKANILFNLIKKKIDKKVEYTHQLPLKKIGEHFTVDVHINHEPITLLLDTGATLTMVNENKISSLTLIKENLILNTAGGKITAQLQEADNFLLGDIKLEKFQVVSSSFEQKEADGLLGMNFFKKFKFKIDQEKSILYLSPKI